MEIPSKYEPGKAESRWYKYWMDNGFFKRTFEEGLAGMRFDRPARAKSR